MRIDVLYFGVLKDHFSTARDSLELDDGSCVGDAIGLLRSRASNIENRVWSSLAVAVNREYSGVSTLLREGDELALLPPVSGGW